MVFVAIGGTAGAILRFLLGLLFMKRFPHPPFPIAMVIVNILGSFGLGVTLALYNLESPTSLYNLIVVGFFGAFTTFSTFSMEAVELFQKKQYRSGILYVVCTIGGSISLFSIGFILFAS
ncbi:fluoride efflux transporter CrcB [Bacillus sp. PS06]|uniref:fluoride efflux transporter CrcB n=1 Tax=Bacillus sp. PS06 TaxID=2764176 RepID=UPI00177E6E45|nr:fluoride efflux transporter CrcB [Bacillus sp. PS06]MBD8069238.1 fluoride efflux transporter CrcB [Bacillus sp. PS06]